MRLDDLDYHLPEDRIAQVPAERREDARLLVLDRASGRRTHRGIVDLPDLLAPGDLLVLNDTRVVPARLRARRATGGQVEVFLLEPGAEPGTWEALVRAARSIRAGERLGLGEGTGEDGIRLLASRGRGAWLVEGAGAGMEAIMARHGEMPLPPYIRREAGDTRAPLDRERYQTVFARHDGAIAAPTAGLHLTPALLDRLRQGGVEVETVTLHVGLGTFEPVRVEDLDEHAMHEERYVVPAATAEAVRRVKAAGGRVVAVGTTSVRTLEAAALASGDGLPRPGAARTDLLIQPGYAFRVVDVLLTNFHLPRSTLLALVAAFAGLDAVRAAYAEAVEEGYRFYSYGDAMLLA